MTSQLGLSTLQLINQGVHYIGHRMTIKIKKESCF